MAMVQAVWIPQSLGLGFEQPYTWIVALLVGLVLGALIGGFQGFIIAYGGVPAFIVTLGGFLVWRGLIFEYAQGQTIAPIDTTFQLLGGGPTGSLGEVGSWIVAILACVGIVYSLITSAAAAQRYGFPLRPIWADVARHRSSCAAVLAAVWVANNYFWPEALAQRSTRTSTASRSRRVASRSRPAIAYPVLIMIGVTLVMTFIATRRRFGRYVYAIGGNPEAAELGGINARRTIM